MALVQSKGQTASSTLTFVNPTVTGNAIVVTCWRFVSDIGAGDITDNKGNTYTLAVANNIMAPKTAIFYCLNPVMGSGHQIIFSGDSGLGIWEVSGLDTAALDKTATGTGGTPSGTATTTTLSQADEEVFAVLCSDQGIGTIDESSSELWTEVYEEDDGSNFLCFSTVHKTVTSTAAVSATWTLGNSGGATICIATFKKAAASDPPNSGAVSGSIAWVGSSTGTKLAKGSASGSIAWVGSSTGEAPVVGANGGSVDGAIAWAGSSTGVSHHTGSATGTIAWVGSSTGIRAYMGAAFGSITWVGVISSTTPYPVEVSGRKWLDQYGEVYFARTLSSWGMAENLTNAEITTALEQTKANNFNGVTVAYGSPVDMGGWHKYQNAALEDCWVGDPWASAFGPGWSSFDWVVTECLRLGLVIHIATFVSWSTSGGGSEILTVSTSDMFQVGVDLATRYPVAQYPNVVWQVMLDTNDGPTSSIGVRIKALFDGINSVEGDTARLRWMEPNQGTTTQSSGWDNDVDVLPSMNSLYYYGGDSTAAVETIYANTTNFPIGDCEPPYDGATHYSGDYGQQLRERSCAVAFEGGVLINYGHENWWPFGATGLFVGDVAGWEDVHADPHTIQQSYIWGLIDEYVTDPTWAPSAWVTTGEGTGETKAACGKSSSAALAYFPTSRSIVVNTTSISSTEYIRLRWFDPVTGTYASISEYELPNSSRSITMPSARGDGTNDFILVADFAVMSLGDASGSISWSGSVIGEKPVVPMKFGAANGAISWSGTSTGAKLTKGSATGSMSWVGIVVGGNLGVVVGSISWVGSVTGVKIAKGGAAGSILWSGTSEGFTPLEGVNDGAAFGTIGWSGSAVGYKLPVGVGSGNINWLGTVVGGNLGVAIGSISWLGSVDGVRPIIQDKSGAAIGSISWTGSGQGTTVVSGHVLGTIVWFGTVVSIIRVDPFVFLLAPHARGYVSEIVVGYKYGRRSGR